MSVCHNARDQKIVTSFVFGEKMAHIMTLINVDVIKTHF